MIGPEVTVARIIDRGLLPSSDAATLGADGTLSTEYSGNRLTDDSYRLRRGGHAAAPSVTRIAVDELSICHVIWAMSAAKSATE